MHKLSTTFCNMQDITFHSFYLFCFSTKLYYIYKNVIDYIFYICRHHPKDKNCKGMHSSLLQRLHREIHAPWVNLSSNNHHYSFIYIHKLGLSIGSFVAYTFSNLVFLLWIVWTGFYCSNNECPTCRRHLSSRRSLRDDPKFDALIAAFFPDIEKYEAEVCIYII